MSQARWDDLYDRLSSRKLWLAVLSIAFAYWNFLEARLTAVEFQAAVFAAVTAFSVAEGAADAVAAYRPRPSGPEQTVNVDTKPPPTEVRDRYSMRGVTIYPTPARPPVAETDP